MSRTPRRWTEEEDRILRREALSQFGESDLKDWHRIAQKLPGRNNKDCRKRWCNNVTEGLRKGQWEEDEDGRLEIGVQKHGHHWAGVSQVVETRSADQCAKRWSHCLNPALDRSHWSKKEDQRLMEAVETHGHSWKYIQTTYYPERAANHVKNRYTILTRRSKTQQQQQQQSQPGQDHSDQSNATSTPASYEDDEFGQALEDSNEEIPDVGSHTVSPTLMHTYPPSHPFTEAIPQQSQWAYPPNTLSSPTESFPMLMPNGLSRSNHVSSRQPVQSGYKAPSPLYIDPTLDPTANWPHDPTDHQPTDYLFDDLLAGSMSSSTTAPLPPASSCLPPVHAPSGFASSSSSSSALLHPSRRPSNAGEPSSRATVRQYTSTLSSHDQEGSIITSSTTTAATAPAARPASPMTIVDSPEARTTRTDPSELSPSARSRLTLTIEEPNPETMADLMGILAKSKAKMKLEVS